MTRQAPPQAQAPPATAASHWQGPHGQPVSKAQNKAHTGRKDQRRTPAPPTAQTGRHGQGKRQETDASHRPHTSTPARTDGRPATDHGGHQHGRTETAHGLTRHGAMTPPAHHHTAASADGQRHGPRATARRNDTDTSDTSKDGQRHGHRGRRRRTQGTQGPAPHTSGDGPQAAAERYQLTRQAHKAQTGRHGPRKDHGGPVDQRTAERPPRATETATTATDGHHHGPTASTADGHQRQGPPASTPATRTDATTADGHGVGQYWRPPVRQATPTPPRTAAHTGHHWRPVQTSFGEYGVSLAYTQVLVSGNATNTPASRAEVGEVIAAEVGPRSRGASSFEFVLREHCPRSTQIQETARVG